MIKNYSNIKKLEDLSIEYSLCHDRISKKKIYHDIHKILDADVVDVASDVDVVVDVAPNVDLAADSDVNSDINVGSDIDVNSGVDSDIDVATKNISTGIIIHNPKTFVELLNICRDDDVVYDVAIILKTLDRSLDKIDLTKLDIDFVLQQLICANAMDVILKLVKRLKLTDAMLKQQHDHMMNSFQKEDFYGRGAARLVYELFMNNYIVPTREMLLEILCYIDMPYEQVQDIITKKEFVTSVFNLYDNIQQVIRLDKYRPIVKGLYGLLQDEEDYRKYAVYTIIYNGFKKPEMLKYKKDRNVQFDDALLKYYVFRATTMEKKVLKFFADEGAKPDIDTITGITLRSTGTHNKILLNNICTALPNFEYHKFYFKKVIRGNNMTLDRIGNNDYRYSSSVGAGNYDNFYYTVTINKKS